MMEQVLDNRSYQSPGKRILNRREAIREVYVYSKAMTFEALLVHHIEREIGGMGDFR
jgi:hypothetical protein